MKQNSLKQSIILGALLHDIGKFMQRAEVSCRYEKDENEMQRVCRYDKEGNFFSHRHSLWTVEFFERYCDYFPEITSRFENPDDNAANFAAKHHNPDTPLQWIVAEADRLSSGMDRLKKDEEDETRRIDIYKRVRLYPVLEEVNIGQEDMTNISKRIELNPLTLQKEDIFPCNLSKLVPGEGDSLVENYSRLWESFIDEFKHLPVGDIQSFVESLLFLLEKYTWCVPSSTIDLPDISLFDHSKTTAAIAACLFDYHQSQNTIDEREICKRKDIEKYILVCGDVSGIQKFIYNITSKGAAKSLKGRSLYLQLLSEGTARSILRRVDYPIANMLYASGGKFYLLLANRYDNALEAVKREINRGLLQKYNGEVYLSIGWSALAGSDFLGKKFPHKWKEASMTANEGKRRKFSSLFYHELFAPSGHGGDRELCDVCKKEDDLQPRDDDSEIMLCRDCADAEKLGRSLFRADYLIEAYKGEGSGDAGFHIPFISTTYHLVPDLRDIGRLEAEKITIYKLNSTDFIIPELKNKNCSMSFKFIGGTDIPQENGKPLTFNDFADKSEGIKRLGILRMDVDNLGEIFTKGFPDRASISRVTTLSRRLSLFFGGYLNTICQSEEYKEKVYIIYSGGDDLFIVGSWNAIVDLAEEIRREFREFTAGNPSFTLSGGIALSGKKYPIYRGADHAGDAEESAKSYKRKGMEKNAITFLNKPLSWSDMEVSRDIKDLLYECVATGKPVGDGNKKLLRGILDRLRRIYLLYETNKNYWKGKERLSSDVVEEKTRYNKWLWRSVYFMDRLGRENEPFKKNLKKVKEALFTDCFEGKNSEREIIDFIDIPTRWVDLLIRREE